MSVQWIARHGIALIVAMLVGLLLIAAPQGDVRASAPAIAPSTDHESRATDHALWRAHRGRGEPGALSTAGAAVDPPHRSSTVVPAPTPAGQPCFAMSRRSERNVP